MCNEAKEEELEFQPIPPDPRQLSIVEAIVRQNDMILRALMVPSMVFGMPPAEEKREAAEE